MQKVHQFLIYHIGLDSASETESPYCLQSAVICTESSWRWAFHSSALDEEGLRGVLCLIFPSAVAWEIFACDSS